LSWGVRVRALLEQGQWEAAWAGLLEAESRGLASHLSYSLLINAAARGGRWRDAVGVILHMRGRGVAVSALDISSAINACRLAGELPAAMALLRVLDARRRREEAAVGGKGQREGEEEEGESIHPYQASCGLVLDLLAKKVPPMRGAAARRKRQSPWHRPPGQGEGQEEKEGTAAPASSAVTPRTRQRKAPSPGAGPKDKKERKPARGGGGGKQGGDSSK
jgi:pentatricopeptide repeat protein